MVRIEKFFFSKLIKKSETNEYNKIKWESPYKNLLFAFLLAKIWLFLEILQKIWIFLNFQQNFWSRSFQWCSRSPKQQFLQKSHYWCDPEKLLKMTKIFVEFFDFWPKYRIFRSKNFLNRFYTSKPSFVQKISFLPWKPDFISIFIDFGRKLPILGDPPLLWTPCPDPPMIRTCPEKNSYDPKRIVGNLQKISGRYGQR